MFHTDKYIFQLCWIHFDLSTGNQFLLAMHSFSLAFPCIVDVIVDDPCKPTGRLRPQDHSDREYFSTVKKTIIKQVSISHLALAGICSATNLTAKSSCAERQIRITLRSEELDGN